MLMIYKLADHLGRPIQEVQEMTTTEFCGWLAYLKIANDFGAEKP